MIGSTFGPSFWPRNWIACRAVLASRPRRSFRGLVRAVNRVVDCVVKGATSSTPSDTDADGGVGTA